MNGNEFPKNELKNGMFGAVEFAPGKLNWFVLVKQNENKFLMIYQEGGSDILGDDETDTFSIENGYSVECDKIVYLVSSKLVRSFGAARFCYENNIDYKNFEWRRKK